MDKHGERWKQIHEANGYETYYPFDIVVSFAFRHAPRDRPRGQVKVLEVGCGLGNNLRFLARAGFDTFGIDISEHAVERAGTLLGEEGLSADLRACSAAALPFDDEAFDLVVDRGTFTVLPSPIFEQAFAEIRRVLRPSGHLLFTPYADGHYSNGPSDGVVDGLTYPVTRGHLAGRDRGIRFMGFNEIRAQFEHGWTLRSLDLCETTDLLDEDRQVISSWYVVAQKAA